MKMVIIVNSVGAGFLNFWNSTRHRGAKAGRGGKGCGDAAAPARAGRRALRLVFAPGRAYDPRLRALRSPRRVRTAPSPEPKDWP